MQKRPICTTKDACLYCKRGLFVSQKRPVCNGKRPVCIAKETQTFLPQRAGSKRKKKKKKMKKNIYRKLGKKDKRGENWGSDKKEVNNHVKNNHDWMRKKIQGKTKNYKGM